MKPLGLPCLALLAVALVGCGGLNPGIQGGFDVVYSVSPAKATVGTGGTVALSARVLEGGYTDLGVAVREGARGGTAVKTVSGDFPDGATYTAPASPGTYHVDVEFLNGTKVSATKTATIKVTASP